MTTCRDCMYWAPNNDGQKYASIVPCSKCDRHGTIKQATETCEHHLQAYGIRPEAPMAHHDQLSSNP